MAMAVGALERVVPEDTVEHAQHDGVDGHGVERPCLSEQGIDPPGAPPFEVVTPVGRVRQHGLELVTGRRRLIGADHARHQGVAVGLEGGHDPLDAVLGHDRPRRVLRHATLPKGMSGQASAFQKGMSTWPTS